ncbi:MAG: hypothetical protein IJS14_01205 [Lentisphaeria bacterium]|nr:hypothetical protein [Lentisphaeria bacterium]
MAFFRIFPAGWNIEIKGEPQNFDMTLIARHIQFAFQVIEIGQPLILTGMEVLPIQFEVEEESGIPIEAELMAPVEISVIPEKDPHPETELHPVRNKIKFYAEGKIPQFRRGKTVFAAFQKNVVFAVFHDFSMAMGKCGNPIYIDPVRHIHLIPEREILIKMIRHKILPLYGFVS